MRVIVNLWGDIKSEVDWSAAEFPVTKEPATLEDALRAVGMRGGKTLFDIIAESDRIKDKYVLFWNGEPLQDSVDMKRKVRTDDKFHVMDREVESENPMEVEN